MKHKISIFWFRRDLRVEDNPALYQATQNSEIVVPVYFWVPNEEGQFCPGRSSRWWLSRSLQSLNDKLKSQGSQLIIRHGTSTQQMLLEILQETKATAIYHNKLYDPISLRRDFEIKTIMSLNGIEVEASNGDMLYDPWTVLEEDKQPCVTFEKFWARCVQLPPPSTTIPEARVLPMPKELLDTLRTETISESHILTSEEDQYSMHLKLQWQLGRETALQQLQTFSETLLEDFSIIKAKLDRNSSSKLSPYLHYGQISIKEVYQKVKEAESELIKKDPKRIRNTSDFFKQLGYREYSRYIMWHFPFTHDRALMEHLRACPFRQSQRLFKAWRQGNTGYPLVDAAMKQLWSTGWLHNRSRVIVSTFLVKNLLLPWQWGLKHFWDALIDADLECATLGWQYVSGCLADAHDFTYIVDHDVESKKFDPDGRFVRQWLPQLSRLPTQYIHTPWKAPPKVLQYAYVTLGDNYPKPIVTLEDSKQLVLYANSVINQYLIKINQPQPYRDPTLPAEHIQASNTTKSTLQQSLNEKLRNHKRQRVEDDGKKEEVAGNFDVTKLPIDPQNLKTWEELKKDPNNLNEKILNLSSDSMGSNTPTKKGKRQNRDSNNPTIYNDTSNIGQIQSS